MEQIRTFTVNRKYAQSVFGSIELRVEYYYTIKDGLTENCYLVNCQIYGIETGDVYIRPYSAKLADFQTETNQYTLIESAVIESFEDELNFQRS